MNVATPLLIAQEKIETADEPRCTQIRLLCITPRSSAFICGFNFSIRPVPPQPKQGFGYFCFGSISGRNAVSKPMTGSHAQT